MLSAERHERPHRRVVVTLHICSQELATCRFRSQSIAATRTRSYIHQSLLYGSHLCLIVYLFFAEPVPWLKPMAWKPFCSCESFRITRLAHSICKTRIRLREIDTIMIQEAYLLIYVHEEPVQFISFDRVANHERVHIYARYLLLKQLRNGTHAEGKTASIAHAYLWRIKSRRECATYQSQIKKRKKKEKKRKYVNLFQ